MGSEMCIRDSYIEVGVIYLIFSTVLTWVQRWGEKKLSAYGAQKE